MENSMKQLTFNNLKSELTENDIDQLVALLGSRCRENTLRKLRINLELCASQIPIYGILDRLMKENDEWSYCAGQSYPDEIRTVRKIILELK